MSPSTNKIALFIDGANLYATAKTLGFDIDYKRLLKEFQSRGTLLRAFYYTAIIGDQEYSSIRPLIDWLDYNGYSVVTKATKEFVDQTGRRKAKGNMDIELAVDAMEIPGSIDHMVLFSGDGDFRSLVEAVQRRGVRVTVISTVTTQPPMSAPTTTKSRSNSSFGGDAGNRGQARAQLSALPAAGGVPQDMARARAGMVQRAGPLLRTARCAAADRGAGPRPARRQPHRPPVHRRLCRRAAVRNACPLRFRARPIRRAPRRRIATDRLPHQQCGALRAAGK